MARQKSCIKYIYKLHSSLLSENDWDLTLPLQDALEEGTLVVGISDSQLLRFIDEINGVDTNAEAERLKKHIKFLKAKPISDYSVRELKKAYKDLYNTQFQKDYVCIVMDSMKDYDRCNKGFYINGIKYKRLLGTNGGIKQSTIIYISERIYPEIKERIDCGRNKDMTFVPAKLEAYQALICSGSIPVSMPRGIIVVPDCETTFLSDVIFIDGSEAGQPLKNGFEVTEPTIEYKKDHEVTLDNSDGMGFMSPQLAYRWSQELFPEQETTIPLSAVNTRGIPWTKGILFTFDFVAFCEEIAESYIVKDAWGTERDVRDAEVILTTSMLKLWDSYDSWEDYWDNVMKYHYTYAVSKTAPFELETVHATNYQFLQSYELNDEDIEELVKPTVDDINEIMGLDYRKSLVYLNGDRFDIRALLSEKAGIKEALYLEPELINDEYVRSTIKENIKVKIKRAKTGVLDISGNFAIIGGDPYALAQSMCGLEVTGLLKSGEIYHKFWSDRGVDEVCLFRAPMTSHNNIRKQRVVNWQNTPNFNEMQRWFKYITTCVLFNAWDTTAEALNGSDKDGDLCFTTDNAVLLKNTKDLPAIYSMQRKAKKKIVTENDIIKATKLAFGDAIGSITNVITSQICALAKFDKNSEEYRTLYNRILAGQQYQQDSIDKAKGIISKPMPKYWRSLRGLRIEREKDDKDTILRKEFLKSISVHKKPYFFIYNYDSLRGQYNRYIKSSENSCMCEFGMTISELKAKEYKTDAESEFLKFFETFYPVDRSECTINTICWYVEKHAHSPEQADNKSKVDIKELLKSPNRTYDDNRYYRTKRLLRKEYDIYRVGLKELVSHLTSENVHGVEKQRIINDYTKSYVLKVNCICPDEEVRCDAMLDIAYSTNKSKKFVWELCGAQIIRNLLERHNNTVTIPIKVYEGETPDFTYQGNGYVMVRKDLSLELENWRNYNE